MPLKKITVIGAGTMGNGIAHVFAQSGFSVHLADVNASQLEKALQTISKNFDRQIAKGTATTGDKNNALSNIKSFTSIDDAAKEAGLRFEHKLCSLYDLVQNAISAKLIDSDLVMFKSVGSALQDVSFAEHIALTAMKKGLGVPLDAALKIKQSIGKNG